MDETFRNGQSNVLTHYAAAPAARAFSWEKRGGGAGLAEGRMRKQQLAEIQRHTPN
jgi:hypothetical protein